MTIGNYDNKQLQGLGLGQKLKKLNMVKDALRISLI